MVDSLRINSFESGIQGLYRETSHSVNNTGLVEMIAHGK